MIDSAGFLWSYVIELRECKARSNELVDPCTICVYIVAIWCSAAYIQGAVRSQAVIYAANIDPSGSHVAFRIEIVPFSILRIIGKIRAVALPQEAAVSSLMDFATTSGCRQQLSASLLGRCWYYCYRKCWSLGSRSWKIPICSLRCCWLLRNVL